MFLSMIRYIEFICYVTAELSCIAMHLHLKLRLVTTIKQIKQAFAHAPRRDTDTCLSSQLVNEAKHSETYILLVISVFIVRYTCIELKDRGDVWHVLTHCVLVAPTLLFVNSDRSDGTNIQLKLG